MEKQGCCLRFSIAVDIVFLVVTFESLRLRSWKSKTEIFTTRRAEGGVESNHWPPSIFSSHTW
jgi:hypothetical protein